MVLRDRSMAAFSALGLSGMKATLDEILAAGIKSRATPEKILCELLAAVLAERKTRSIRYSHVATTEEIVGNGYNLNVPRYVGMTEEEPLNLELLEKNRKGLWADLMRLDREIGQLMKAE